MTNEQQAVYVSALEAQLDTILEELESRLLDVLPDSEIEFTKKRWKIRDTDPDEFRSIPLLYPLKDFSQLLQQHRQMLSVGQSVEASEPDC